MATCGIPCNITPVDCNNDCSVYEKPLCYIYYKKAPPGSNQAVSQVQQPVCKTPRKKKRKAKTTKKACNKKMVKAIEKMKQKKMCMDDMLGRDPYSYEMLRSMYPRNYRRIN